MKLIDCANGQIIQNGAKPGFPQTVLSAILVTPRLGLNYLWVDAYCVEQNNPAILHQRVQQMVQIYCQAKLTIIAAASNHSSESLIGGSSPRSIIVPEFVIEGVHLAEYRSEYWSDVPDGPWTSRGWTFQEELHLRCRHFFTLRRTLRAYRDILVLLLLT